MTSPASPVCMRCERLVIGFGDWHCAAFPKGIPDIIMYEGHSHKKALPGDNGILFKEGEPSFKKKAGEE